MSVVDQIAAEVTAMESRQQAIALAVAESLVGLPQDLAQLKADAAAGSALLAALLPHRAKLAELDVAALLGVPS